MKNMPPNKSETDPEIMLQLSNDLIRIEMVINRLEHDRLDMLQNGDPVLDDKELCHLNPDFPNRVCDSI